jgi:hypothetical protein
MKYILFTTFLLLSVFSFAQTRDLNNNQPVKVGDKTFYILNVKDQSLNGAKQVRIVDKGFVSTKEYKKNALAAAGGRGVYNVTI